MTPDRERGPTPAFAARSRSADRVQARREHRGDEQKPRRRPPATRTRCGRPSATPRRRGQSAEPLSSAGSGHSARSRQPSASQAAATPGASRMWARVSIGQRQVVVVIWLPSRAWRGRKGPLRPSGGRGSGSAGPLAAFQQRGAPKGVLGDCPCQGAIVLPAARSRSRSGPDCCSAGPSTRKVSSTRLAEVVILASCRFTRWRARTRAIHAEQAGGSLAEIASSQRWARSSGAA